MFQWLGRADNITATLVALVVLWRTAQGIYRATIGKTRDITARLNQVTCGIPSGRVAELFGMPVYRDFIEGRGLEPADDEARNICRCVYDLDRGLLTTHLVGDTVAAFAFTRTDPSFRYSLNVATLGIYNFELGAATFAKMNTELPVAGQAYVGASTFGYTETAYFGRPGCYNYYALSSTMIGAFEDSPISKLGDVVWGIYVENRDADARTVESGFSDKEHALDAFRREARPDTFAIFGTVDPFRYQYADASGAVGHQHITELLHKRHLVAESSVRRRTRRTLNRLLALPGRSIYIAQNRRQ